MVVGWSMEQLAAMAAQLAMKIEGGSKRFI
jgi:hypothetical protein